MRVRERARARERERERERERGPLSAEDLLAVGRRDKAPEVDFSVDDLGLRP